jgi:hypothetical protein
MITALGLEKLGFVPEVDFTLRNDNDGRGVYIEEWLSESPQPSESNIDEASKVAEAEYDAQEYARNRAAEYPSIAELTVALYDTDDKAAIETKRAAVKAKYPKPS